MTLNLPTKLWSFDQQAHHPQTFNCRVERTWSCLLAIGILVNVDGIIDRVDKPINVVNEPSNAMFYYNILLDKGGFTC